MKVKKSQHIYYLHGARSLKACVIETVKYENQIITRPVVTIENFNELIGNKTNLSEYQKSICQLEIKLFQPNPACHFSRNFFGRFQVNVS